MFSDKLANQTIYFEGVVHPERVGMSHSPINIKFKTEEGDECEIIINVLMSKISVVCRVQNFSDNIHTLKNIVQNFSDRIVGIFCLKNIYGYEVEISSAVSENGKEKIVFGVEEKIFGEGDSIPELPSNEVLLMADDQLAIAVNDFKDAIRKPDFTAAYCHRAIESVAWAFGNKSPENYIECRKKLNLKKETVEKYFKTSNPMRHGRMIRQTWEQRADQLRIAREIIRRYSFFVSVDRIQLDEVKFPNF